MGSWLSWLERCLDMAEIPSSNLGGPTKKECPRSSVGLERKIPDLEAVSSSLTEGTT